MDKRDIKSLIEGWEGLGQLQPPPLSGDFEARFWARVQRESQPASGWRRWVDRVLLNPVWAGALASVLISVVTGAVMGGFTRQSSVTAQGIGLFVSSGGLGALADGFVASNQIEEGE